MAIEKLYLIDCDPNEISIIRSRQSDFSGFIQLETGWQILSNELKGQNNSEICFLSGLEKWDITFCKGAYYDKDNDSLVLNDGVFRISMVSKDNRKRQFVLTGRN